MLDIRGRVVSFPIPDIGLPPASARTSLCQPEPHLDNYFRKYKKDERKDIFWDIRKPSPAKADVFKHIAKTPMLPILSNRLNFALVGKFVSFHCQLYTEIGALEQVETDIYVLCFFFCVCIFLYQYHAG